MSCSCEGQNGRRGFFKKVLAGALGGVAGLVPLGAGLAVFLDPLRRRGEGGQLVRVASLNALPHDGIPRRFPVLANRTDAWNRFPEGRIGAVYLRRTAELAVEAFTVVCPHAGCFVNFIAERNLYLCPCHDSTFAIDGSIEDRRSPSPRGLDSLEVEIRDGHEIWVKFENFRTGLARKIPVA